MTTLVLRNPYSLKIAAFIDDMLGSASIRTFRSWYKGHQLCDFAVVREGRNATVHCSGGIRFKLMLQQFDDGEMKGRITLLGWLRETPNALRIIAEILELQASRNSQLLEGMGFHFSICSEDARIPDCERIDDARSDFNFELAIRSHWYHRDFATFCKKYGIKCYFREVYQISAACYQLEAGEGSAFAGH